MSESREKKRRYNEKVEFASRFEAWLAAEPPMFLFWKWAAWKRRRPILKREDRK